MNTVSQVTTKKGDDGSTQTLGGDRVPKHHVIIECTGCVDEARAQTALLRLHFLQSGQPDNDGIGDFLWWLLHVYFVMGAACSDPANRKPEWHVCPFGPAFLNRLETFQIRLEAQVQLPKKFIASASTILAAETDALTTTVRRLERAMVALAKAEPAFDPAILVFVNRLSDTLYMLARLLDNGSYHAVDYNILLTDQ